MKEPFEKPPFFDHEKLVAYQRSIQFVAWATELLENIPTSYPSPINSIVPQLPSR